MTEQTVDLRSYLHQYAQLDRFWILKSAHIQPGLIHYLGSDGTAYVLMDDDDVRVEKCIEFLRHMNCPVFNDVNEMDAYAEQLAIGRG